jgi:hypothetical protein
MTSFALLPTTLSSRTATIKHEQSASRRAARRVLPGTQSNERAPGTRAVFMFMACPHSRAAFPAAPVTDDLSAPCASSPGTRTTALVVPTVHASARAQAPRLARAAGGAA